MKKMKNKINIILLSAVTALAMSSCGDFLNIKPRTFVSDDNFWNEKTDVEQMVTGLYTKMQSDAFIRRCIVWGEVRSDNTGMGLDVDKNTDLERTLKENLLSTNGYTTWVDFYNIINQCNIIIARAPEVSESDHIHRVRRHGHNGRGIIPSRLMLLLFGSCIQRCSILYTCNTI